MKGTKRYGENNNIYINNSFNSEFKFLNYAIRRASIEKTINRYNTPNGVPYAQREGDGNIVQVAHILDLQNLGLTVPERKELCGSVVSVMF